MKEFFSNDPELNKILDRKNTNNSNNQELDNSDIYYNEEDLKPLPIGADKEANIAKIQLTNPEDLNRLNEFCNNENTINSIMNLKDRDQKSAIKFAAEEIIDRKFHHIPKYKFGTEKAEVKTERYNLYENYVKDKITSKIQEINKRKLYEAGKKISKHKKNTEDPFIKKHTRKQPPQTPGSSKTPGPSM